MGSVNAVAHLCLIVFLFSLITTHDQVLGAEEADPVLDTEGNILRVGTSYFMETASIFPSSGVRPSRMGCPVGVVRAPLLDNGIPLTFTPVNSKEGVIRLSTDLNIRFSIFIPRCNQTSLWKLDDRSSSGQYFITLSGIEGNSGPEIIRNWFKIEKSTFNSYKLVYCPTVFDLCQVTCKDVGIYFDGVEQRLALSDFPQNFVFQRFGSPLAMN